MQINRLFAMLSSPAWPMRYTEHATHLCTRSAAAPAIQFSSESSESSSDVESVAWRRADVARGAPGRLGLLAPRTAVGFLRGVSSSSSSLSSSVLLSATRRARPPPTRGADCFADAPDAELFFELRPLLLLLLLLLQRGTFLLPAVSEASDTPTLTYAGPALLPRK